MRAFLYLVSHTARNRFLFQLKRARNPRYGVALIVAGFYIWAFLVRPTRVGLGDIFLNRTSETIAALLMVITLSGTWVFGSDRLALSFTQAELSMLFPAPLTRRQLIGYKLYRAQIAVLINSLIWVFVLRRGGTALSAPLRAISIWIVFSTLNLHRLGAALVRASFAEHGRAGARRNLPSIAFFSAVVASLVAGAIIYRNELIGAPDTGSFFIALSEMFSRPPASYGLLPFELVIRPTFAQSAAVWAKAIGPAVAMLVAHIIWVMINDTAFEDAAIEASAQRAKRLEAFRSRRSGGQVVVPKAARASLRLSAVGHPALAIFWKNLLCLRRTAEWRVVIAPAVMALVIGSAASNAGHQPAKFIAVAALVFALMLLTFAGRMIRNDLRHDMLNLPLLKTLPISGRDLVLAEVASSALPVAGLQLVLIVIAFVASLWMYHVPIPMGIRLGLLIASPFAVLSLNGALLTMQNGLAVLFPAWMRLGSTVNSGVEALGQNLISTMANLLSLAFALIIPLVVAFIAVRYFMLSGALATAAVTIFTSAALAVETYAVINYLGKAIVKAEPQSNAVA
jgi:hypothetical protein